MNRSRKHLSILAIVLLIGAATQANAITQVKMRGFNANSGGNYRADPNTELEYILANYALGKSTDGTWFGTFCVEYNEHFRSGHTYDVSLNDGAVRGGESGAVNGKDIISIGTAFLYKHFALGTLTGFTYGSKQHAKQLQNTIWELEGETSGANNFGSFLSLAQSVTDWNQDYSGGAVKVMNLTRNNGTQHHQDQLVYTGSSVPDTGSTLAFMALSITALIGLRRRYAQ